MDRKNFIKKTLLGAVGVATGSTALNARIAKTVFTLSFSKEK